MTIDGKLLKRIIWTWKIKTSGDKNKGNVSTLSALKSHEPRHISIKCPIITGIYLRNSKGSLNSQNIMDMINLKWDSKIVNISHR